MTQVSESPDGERIEFRFVDVVVEYQQLGSVEVDPDIPDRSLQMTAEQMESGTGCDAARRRVTCPTQYRIIDSLPCDAARTWHGVDLRRPADWSGVHNLSSRREAGYPVADGGASGMSTKTDRAFYWAFIIGGVCFICVILLSIHMLRTDA
jgi:hypothetical protein